MGSARSLLYIRLALGLISLTAVALSAQPIRVERLRGYELGRAHGLQSGQGIMPSDEGIEVAGGTALVRFDSALSPDERAARLAQKGARVLETYDTGWALIELPPGQTVAQGLAALSGVTGVARAAPNRVFHPNKSPNDPSALTAYHLGKINAFSAWEYEVGDSSTVTIAVMDTGIEGTHPELSSKLHSSGVSQSQDCLNAPCVDNHPPTDACGHGTGVAGVAAAQANNGVGLAGISWGAKLVSLKIFDATCDNGSEAQIIRALQYARNVMLTDSGVNRLVVNMSIGACNTECDTALSAETIAARDAGIVLIAAAGNHGGSSGCSFSTVQSPANCEGVMPVGATDDNDAVTNFSAQGSSLAAFGVVAPGKNVPMPGLNGGQASGTGTSFSAPIVAGLAALILSAKAVSISPDATGVQEVKNIIRNSAQGIGVSSLGLASVGPQGNTAGSGRINAYRAMRLAVKGTLSDFEGDKKAIAFPNPFRPGTHGTATITIPQSLEGKNPNVKIYAFDGQLIRDLGGNTTWNGRNDSGRQVATGTYIFRVKTDTGLQTGRIAVIR